MVSVNHNLRTNMNNSLTYYREVGSKCAIARQHGDESTAKFHQEWCQRAMKMEAKDVQPNVMAAFNEGYKSEQKAPIYFH